MIEVTIIPHALIYLVLVYYMYYQGDTEHTLSNLTASMIAAGVYFVGIECVYLLGMFIAGCI